jgi:hypothetical protein
MEARGLITAITHPELKELVSSGSKCAFYGGFDPTGPSLHVGHLVMISAMVRGVLLVDFSLHSSQALACVGTNQCSHT